MMLKKDIRSLSKEELRLFFISKGHAQYRADQVYEWLWQKAANSFDAMTNLSLPLRKELKQNFSFHTSRVESTQKSTDGTLKSSVILHDNLFVETVLIPAKKRFTACVSSQVGCSLNCNFCATARLKRMRNLNAGEIYDQVVFANQQSKKIYNSPLTNIVFMGMGEPLLNYPETMKAIEKITAPEGLGMSARRITLSTSGIPKMIKKLADDTPGIKLAVSLHSAVDAIRTKIMPFNERFPLDQIQDALLYWYQKTKSLITFEYVVWKGINDTAHDIEALVTFCKKQPCKVNLIEYNPIGDPDFEQADEIVVEAYRAALEKARIVCKIRRSRGRDINAACGQLANTKENIKR